MTFKERRAFRAKCKAEHLCYRCGTPLDVPTGKYCGRCKLDIEDETLKRRQMILFGAVVVGTVLGAFSKAISDNNLSNNGLSGDDSSSLDDDSLDSASSISSKRLGNGKKCQNCGAFMTEYDNYWDCEECGASELKEPFHRKIPVMDFGYTGSMPAGCAACGGDYPNCKDSCPIFDD